MPPEVLAQLVHLNAVYERRYPGLRYITFVNGRTSAEIRDEMQRVLRVVEDAEGGGDGEIEHFEVGGSKWTEELNRTVLDVGRIAKSRLAALSVVK